MDVLRLLRLTAAAAASAVLAFGVGGMVVPKPASAVSLVCSASSWVNVRSGPGTSYPILGRLAAGESIESRGVATASGWTPVTFQGKAAFISSTYLRLPGATAAPKGPIAGYAGVQLANAQLIIRAGQAMGLDDWTITVGVMTAMGESSLRNVNYGDKAGPDSRGLFQQRANGAWGSYRDRMNPTIAATNFFKALLRVPNYHKLTPTLAAHRTQRNRDPNHYTKYWSAAVKIYAALKGTATAAALAANPSPSAPTGSLGKDSRTTTGNVNVRAGAGLTFPVVGVAAKGTSLVVTGRTSNGFAEITYNGQARWVSASYLAEVPDATRAAQAVHGVTAAWLTMRAAGSATSASYGLLPAGSRVPLTGKTAGAYSEIEHEGNLRWILSAYVTPTD